MRLIALESNQSSFQPVTFNRSGITIIEAVKSDSDNISASRTYNGSGKSLIIHILHFCLGSSEISEFETKLPGWEFRLKFQLESQEYLVVRNTQNQKEVELNGQKLKLDDYTDFLERRCFNIDEKIQFLTFRSLIPFFIRRYKNSYSRRLRSQSSFNRL